MKKWYLLGLLIVPFLLTGCGSSDDDSNIEIAEGWHFQGRDCLACHNVDLAEDKNLLVGGTLFIDKNISDVDDMSQNCGGDFVINFLDTSYTTQISSTDYEDLDSNGYEGKGNIFILSRMLDTLNDNYIIQIVDRDTNKTLAQSGIHSFNSTDYNISNSIDYSNRLSCNACHNGDEESRIYVQLNQDLCE